jgi:ketosteroid isomerase-like protein
MSNFEVIAAHYAASDCGDLAGMLAPLMPDTTWTEAAGFPYAGTYVGPEAVRRNVVGAARRWARRRRVGTYQGTHRRSGRSFTARVAHVWTFTDGHLSSFEQIVDSAPVRVAVDGDRPGAGARTTDGRSRTRRASSAPKISSRWDRHSLMAVCSVLPVAAKRRSQRHGR